MGKKIIDKILSIGGILLYYLYLRKTQYWDLRKIEEYQFKNLKKQLISASKTKYYSRLFKDINFNPSIDFRSIKDISKIPITEKSLVKESLESFIRPSKVWFSLEFFTSGSTGMPMKAYVHPFHWIIEQAVIFRHWKWGGYSFRDRTAMLRSYSPKEGEKLWKYNWALNTLYFSPFHMTTENLRIYYEEIQKFKPKVLRGYPSSIKSFCVFLSEQKLELPSVRQVLTASEVLPHKDRIFIEGVLNCKISNHYGLAEQIVMMGDCEEHTHLHNYFEYGYLELLDTDDPNIKRIIGTNLHNRTMPLLRYDTGDLALMEGDCICKRNSFSLKQIIGRSDQSIDAPNGAKIPTVNFYTMFQDFTEISQWQIVVSENELSFKFTSESALELNRELELMKRISQRVSETGFEITLEKVNTLTKSKEGKVKTLIKL